MMIVHVGEGRRECRRAGRKKVTEEKFVPRMTRLQSVKSMDYCSSWSNNLTVHLHRNTVL